MRSEPPGRLRSVDARAYAKSLRRDAAALADAAEGNLDRRVPSCPDWTVADLVHHVGVDVFDFWGQVAERGLQDPNEAVEPERPPDDRLVTVLKENAKRLADVLEGADPTVPVWGWSPRKDIGFIQRRMAQETAIHRWDAQAAVGAQEPIDPELAADGIDEFLELFITEEDGRLAEGGETVLLRATDSIDRWLVQVADGRLTFGRSPGPADVTAAAPLSGLLLLMWRRVTPADIDVEGDRRALERFLARADLD